MLIWVSRQEGDDDSGLETAVPLGTNWWQKMLETVEEGGENHLEGMAGWLEYMCREKEASRPLGSTEKASNNCGVGAGTSYPPCATAEVCEVNLVNVKGPCPRLHSRLLLIHHVKCLTAGCMGVMQYVGTCNTKPSFKGCCRPQG